MQQLHPAAEMESASLEPRTAPSQRVLVLSVGS
jgi:hypothetical protein